MMTSPSLEPLEPRQLLSVTFGPAATYPTGVAPQSVTSADFSGDGKADLAVADSWADTVSVLRGNGDGTFAAKVDFTTADSPVAITAGDFNGDGKADLATASTISALDSAAAATTTTK